MSNKKSCRLMPLTIFKNTEAYVTTKINRKACPELWESINIYSGERKYLCGTGVCCFGGDCPLKNMGADDNIEVK